MTTASGTETDAERRRLAEADAGRVPWRAWGPYLSERAWGTVREDYSPGGDAWGYFPHDHARSRVFRWNEDGLAGVCDDEQHFCFALAFWNGRDPILKERMFGLTGPQGNHGEDVKEYWWYLDSTPTHSWMRWRYHYPQAEFPYGQLVAENARRTRDDPEFELVDTGVFAGDRYWVVEADFAKAGPTDYCIRLRVRNRGPEPATLHVLPTLWFRNTWSWGRPGSPAPSLVAEGARLAGSHPSAGDVVLAGDGDPTPLACDNETNTARLYGSTTSPPYPKDGIGDHVVHGAATVNPQGTGTKGALWYRLEVAPGATAQIRLRLTSDGAVRDVGADWERVLTARRSEADAYYAALAPAGLSADDGLILRQAFAGMLWGKQFYHYDVQMWLDGDPAPPPPPPQRRTGRNAAWKHLNNHDVISMPDPWEYPWYAGWDLAFHCVTLAYVDPWFAKQQLVLLAREWYMHPNGQLPAYEWDFGDVNPPVHAWAARRVFEIDGGGDYEFLERVFHKLLINFTWWVNRKDAQGNNVFQGGFLGLDNIGPFDRSALPVAGVLEQSDGTAWMAMYCLDMLDIALTLAGHDRTYTDVATKFLEHYAYISDALVEQGLWDDDDGFYYDVLLEPDGTRVPLRVRSMVGLIPLCAVTQLSADRLEGLEDFVGRMRWFMTNKPQFCRGFQVDHPDEPLLAVVGVGQLQRLLVRLLDEREFLSAHGLRALSAAHRDQPVRIEVEGFSATVDYEPGESRSGLFGGNSNWRGPVWMPLNYLVVGALRRYADYLGPALTVELPAGSGVQQPLHAAAGEVRERLLSLFRRDPLGRRPVFGDVELFQRDPDWCDLLTFNEYFHGDTGAGLGASHQTGWTGLVAALLMEPGG